MKIDKGHSLVVDSEGGTVKFTVWVQQSGKGWRLPFKWERGDNEFEAALIAESLSSALSDRIKQVRTEEYERGYKDGRSKRAKDLPWTCTLYLRGEK